MTDVERRGETTSWFYHALLRLHLGDIDGYRDTCARMLDRYADALDFATTQRRARACVLLLMLSPTSSGPRLGDRVPALAPDVQDHREITAATYYRAGRYEAALAFLEQASKLKPNSDGEAYGNLFRAMAHDRLGDHDEARRWLNLAVPSIDWDIPERHDGTARKLSLNWDLRLILPLLRREAEAQIKEGRPLYLPANVQSSPPGRLCRHRPMVLRCGPRLQGLDRLTIRPIVAFRSAKERPFAERRATILHRGEKVRRSYEQALLPDGDVVGGVQRVSKG